jgi:hypothetical protein
VAAQNAHGPIDAASRVADQASWSRLTPIEIICVDQKLHQTGSNLQITIRQGIKPSAPQFAEIRTLCRKPLAQISSNTAFYHVADTKTPDNSISLRSKPSTSAGRAVTTLPSGNLLRVLKLRDDGWWYVRAIPSGKKGWARSQIADTLLIECCESRSVAQRPSFDCLKATYADERAICINTELAELDKVVAAGLEAVRKLHGDQYTKEIATPLLEARRACGSDVICIKSQQLASLKEFQKNGAQISYPTLAVNEASIANNVAMTPLASAGGLGSSAMAQLKPAEGAEIPERTAEGPSRVTADRSFEPEATKSKAAEPLQHHGVDAEGFVSAGEVTAYRIEEKAAEHNWGQSALIGAILVASSMFVCLFFVAKRNDRRIVSNPSTPATSLDMKIEPSTAKQEAQPTIAEKGTNSNGMIITAAEPTSSLSYEQISLDLGAHDELLTTFNIANLDSGPPPISGKGSSERTKEHAKMQVDYIIEKLSQYTALRANGTLTKDEHRKLISKLIGLKDGDPPAHLSDPSAEFDLLPQKKVRRPSWAVIMSGVGVIVALLGLWVFV